MTAPATGAAPFSASTENRRRAMGDGPSLLLLFLGTWRREELPYFGPLQKVPEKLLAKHFCYSRVAGQPRVYVQDRIRTEAAVVAGGLQGEPNHFYLFCPPGNGKGGVEALVYGFPRASPD